MWPIAVNDNLTPLLHDPIQVFKDSKWDGVPLVDKDGTKFLGASWLDLTGWNTDMELIPYMFYGI
jgi:hypothetical protein